MKQLFFAGSFAIATFFAYGINTNSGNIESKTGISYNDTTPGSKKDSSKKMKKGWGKDSSMKNDSMRPKKDSI